MSTLTILNTSVATEQLDVALMKEHATGMTVTESLERRGLIKFDDVVGVAPWEIDEDQDTIAPAPVAPVPNLVPREYIGEEIARNKANSDLWVAMVRIAYGHNDPVMVGHHIGFEIGNDFTTENEIPSADTLIFDHVIMGAVFGESAVDIMSELARLPTAKRDSALRALFRQYHPEANLAEISPAPAHQSAA
jgi:hypothetical protein